jgi:phosphoglycolate phosphatase
MRRLTRIVLRKRARKRAALRRPPRLVLFDFDGTIADTFETAFGILNVLAIEFGFRQLDRNDLEKCRDMRTRELMKFLHIPATKMSRIARRGTEELRNHLEAIHPLPGMADLVRELHSLGVPMGIITSNSRENVAAFLARHDLACFKFIRSSSKLLGKAREIKAVIKSENCIAEEILMVGDETRDIEAAKKAGVRCAAVAWGYNSLRALEALEPNHVVHNPTQILPLVLRAKKKRDEKS